MPNSAVARLEQLSQEHLVEYVRDRLMGRPSEPAVNWSHGDTPERFVEDAYALGSDLLKQRLKAAVWRLLQGWRPELGDGLAYGDRLIYLAGALGVEGSAELLESLAFSEALEGLALEGEPLANRALRTLLDFPGQEARGDLWRPLLLDRDFFDTAYAAMALGPRFSDAMGALPGYLQLAVETGLNEAIVEERLTILVERHLRPGPPQRWTALRDIVDRLPAEQHQLAEVLLARIAPEAWATARPTGDLLQAFPQLAPRGGRRPLEIAADGRAS